MNIGLYWVWKDNGDKMLIWLSLGAAKEWREKGYTLEPHKSSIIEEDEEDMFGIPYGEDENEY